MVADRLVVLPWSNVYGLARTLVALGTAGTLAFSSVDTLFRPVALAGDFPPCQGATSAAVFCMAEGDRTGLAWLKWLCVVILLVVASGWRPAFTALPHAYVSYSVFAGIAISDGGDQIGLILSMLFVLPALGDPRRWHWQAPPSGTGSRARRGWALIGSSGLLMLRLQMSVVYFNACVAKLPHQEWYDGTAMWYWSTNLSFGAPTWLDAIVRPVVSTSWGVALMTWLPLFIEITLAAALLLPPRMRYAAMWAGLLFHFAIGLMMGLWSFALAMAGGILVLCLPPGTAITRRRTRPAVETTAETVGSTSLRSPARTAG
ncbi:HTTM domain-containing protein [Streptomyces sp. AC536]|uniref:sporulation-delaying protein SdpB family protein n=1 Tax=Streptomyces buecherae TaxID=2763006 RepID=UPI00164E9937|nr:sporulation-delaying protein SdpB family protein [Streptomyces buecherae]MBC3986346.1 HTTM domain-containing protein [Streptomyces buecherae]QNJ41708.1 HTTM domain-containing protein [Streptomyces buecherae]